MPALPDLQDIREDGPGSQCRPEQKKQPQTGLLSCTHAWTAGAEDAPPSDMCAVQTPSEEVGWFTHRQAAGEKQD